MAIRLVSVDGQVVSGSVDFEIDLPQSTATPTPSPARLVRARRRRRKRWATTLYLEGTCRLSGGDLPASAVLIAIVLAIMAMLLMVARQRVRPDDVQQSPGS